MARPTLNPNARFAHEKAIWEAAITNNGTLWHAKNNNDAIRITMRLNMYRKLLRQQSPDGLIYEDYYIVSRKDNMIAIKKRPPIEGYGTTLDGRPLKTPEQVQEQLIRNIVDDTDQGRKLQIDPDKPLGLE